MNRTVLVLACGLDEGETVADLAGHWTPKIPREVTSEWPWRVTTSLYSCDPAASHHLPVAPVVGDSGSATLFARLLTWDILSAVAESSILHVSRPYTRAGEIALLAGKILGKRIVASDLEPKTSVLGNSLGLLQLAETIICRSDTEARSYSGNPSVEVVDFSTEGWLDELNRIYAKLQPVVSS